MHQPDITRQKFPLRCIESAQMITPVVKTPKRLRCHGFVESGGVLGLERLEFLQADSNQCRQFDQLIKERISDKEHVVARSTERTHRPLSP